MRLYKYAQTSSTIDLPATIQSEPWRFRRKDSAEQPFDLERAKAGDDVQIIAGDVLIDFDFLTWLKFGTTDYHNIEFNYPNDLRMKFPPKVNHE